jgi:hypothetical protein
VDVNGHVTGLASNARCTGNDHADDPPRDVLWRRISVGSYVVRDASGWCEPAAAAPQ